MSETQSTDESTDTPDLTSDSGGFACATEVQVLETYFETFATILDELKLHIDPDGLYGIGVDAANVAYAEDTLATSAFDHYSSTGGVIGVDLTRLLDILSLGESDDTVRLELDQETRKLAIDVAGLEFTVALIDPDAIRQEPDMPDLDLPAGATLEGRHLSRAVTATDMVSDHIRILVDRDVESVYARADGDTDTVDLELTEDDLESIEPEDASALYSLDYLDDLESPIPDDAEVTLRLADDHPIELAYDHIERDDAMHGEARLLLAPRIQKD